MFLAGQDRGWYPTRFKLVTPPEVATFAGRPEYDWLLPTVGVRCKDVASHFNFNLGNVLKYLWRHGRKPGEPALKDLRKALDYLNEEIKRLEALGGNS